MQTENISTQGKKNKISLVLYIGGSIVALLGAAFLINNIMVYNTTMTQALAMGYESSAVNAQLLPSQLLPALFEGFGVYGGISMLLFCTGFIFQKISNFMDQSTLINQPTVDEFTIETLPVNVSEINEIETVIESSDSEISENEQEIPAISIDEETTEKPDDQK